MDIRIPKRMACRCWSIWVYKKQVSLFTKWYAWLGGPEGLGVLTCFMSFPSFFFDTFHMSTCSSIHPQYLDLNKISQNPAKSPPPWTTNNNSTHRNHITYSTAPERSWLLLRLLRGGLDLGRTSSVTAVEKGAGKSAVTGRYLPKEPTRNCESWIWMWKYVSVASFHLVETI